MAADQNTPHEFRPDTQFLNQHFLNPTTARALVDQTGITEDDVVLDVGAGTGVLTAEIQRRRPRRIIAVEADPRCAPALRALAARSPRLEVRFARIQNIHPADLSEVTMIVANPPFSALEHIAALMRDLRSLRAADMCVSNTWATSVTAPPTSNRYSVGSLSIQTRFDAHIVQLIEGSLFTPPTARPAAWLHLSPASRTDPILDMLADAGRHRAGMRVKELLRSPRMNRLPGLRRRVQALGRDVGIKELQQRRLSALTMPQLAQLVRAITAAE